MALAWLENPSPVEPVAFALYLLGCYVGALFVGAVGIGGVLVVPLMLVIGVDVRVAVSAALASFFWTALVGVVTYARRGCISYADASLLCAGAAPTAGAAALLLQYIPRDITSGIIACVATWCGLHMTRKSVRELRGDGNTIASCSLDNAEGKMADRVAGKQTDRVATSRGEGAAGDSDGKVACGLDRATGLHGSGGCDGAAPGYVQSDDIEVQLEQEQPQQGPVEARVTVPFYPFALKGRCGLAGIGMVVGLGSVMTATGGPFLFLPLVFLAFPKLPPTQAVALSQCVALPISIVATVVCLVGSTVDLGLAACTSGCMMLGVPVGAHIALKVPSGYLKLAISLVLVIIGIYTFARVVLPLL
eukprot:NODE_9195_length_1440_cov_11.562833.p1 GENE.NODE_9195_length_1440_cov_11.562833~~NODE_9195_length_1440_cov_11.562833.p1  ORF type:complete len:362 (-),score=48.25 NODE_9195_length_1440_cov_11.562833:274-1359(-)